MKALIVGRAVGVWEEVEAAKKLGAYDSVTVIGKAGIDYPEPFDHWVSWHWNLFPHWQQQRELKGRDLKAKLWSGMSRGNKHNPRRRQAKNSTAEFVICNGGSSGLLAIFVNIHLGATKIVLTGIPMLQDRGHYDEAGPWRDAPNYHTVWQEAAPELQGKVKSMSGWTGGIFGTPTEEWFLSATPTPTTTEGSAQGFGV